MVFSNKSRRDCRWMRPALQEILRKTDSGVSRIFLNLASQNTIGDSSKFHFKYHRTSRFSYFIYIVVRISGFKTHVFSSEVARMCVFCGAVFPKTPRAIWIDGRALVRRSSIFSFLFFS